MGNNEVSKEKLESNDEEKLDNEKLFVVNCSASMCTCSCSRKFAYKTKVRMKYMDNL